MAHAAGAVIGGAIGFVAGLGADILTGGAAAAIGINPFSGMMAGVGIGESIQGGIEANKAAQTSTAAEGSGPSDTSGIGTQGGTQTTTIDGQTVETQYALAEQTVQQQEAATSAAKSAGLAQIGGMEVSEASQESAIRAAAASRGFKLSGTAGEELSNQQQAGRLAIGQAKGQLSTNIAERKAATETGYQSFRASAAMKDYSYTQQANNAWLGAYSSIANAGTTLMKHWKPSLAGGSQEFTNQGPGYQYQPGYGWGYGGY